MDAVTGTFLGIGAFAVLLMLLSLVGGAHLGHLHVGHVDLHLGHIGHAHVGTDSGGMQLTLPSIAGFIGALGFGGAIVASLLPFGGTTAVLLALVIGLAVAVPAAWAAGRLMAAAINMPTDATPTSSDLLGAIGAVISDIPAGGLGEVRLAHAGQQMKVYARADAPLPRGARVFVVEVPTPTSVLVEQLPESGPAALPAEPGNDPLTPKEGQ
jgi:membrane protein implicated in regulation of membrane protease activity